MEDHVYLIRSYLPVIYLEDETNEFVDYLVSAYIENLPNEKYQFSYTAFHMLYMSFIYKTKWFLKEHGNTQIEESLQEYSKQNKVFFNGAFDLSQMMEKTSLEKLMRPLSFHANDIDLCKNLVEVRNKCSHASGKIYFKRIQQIENYILEGLDNVSSIQKKVYPQLRNIFENFIENKWNTNWIENDIRTWIIENYISQKDIESMLRIKLLFLKQDSNNKEILFKKILYCVTVSEFVKLLDVKDDSFLQTLPLLMKGLPETIDLRQSLDDAPKLRQTQELIEEKIVPILTTLSEQDATRAQEILKLSEA